MTTTTTTLTTTTAPAAIVRALQSAPANEPAQVDLATAGAATIAACKNPYKAGFAITVLSNGSRYAVGGFRTTPSRAQLAEAIKDAKDYVSRHAL